MKKKARAAKKTRLHEPNKLEEISGILARIEDGEWAEFRPRTSSKETDWEFMDQESHLINAERNNYRTGHQPKIYVLPDDEYTVYSGEEDVDMDFAKRIIRLVHKCQKAKKAVTLRSASEADDTEYDVIIRANGNCTVGCKEFTYQDILDFERRFGKYLK